MNTKEQIEFLDSPLAKLTGRVFTAYIEQQWPEPTAAMLPMVFHGCVRTLKAIIAACPEEEMKDYLKSQVINEILTEKEEV